LCLILNNIYNLKAPRIVSELPGPKVRELMKFAGPRFPKYIQPVMEKAEGIFVEDPDGNIFIDFISDRCVANIGHSHPEFVRALQNQMAIGTTGLTLNLLRMMMKLNQVTPGKQEKMIFCGLSGSAMNDLAIKLSRKLTGHQNIVSFAGSYHGSTYGALSLSSYIQSSFKGFGPLVPGIHKMPYPSCYRCIFKSEYPKCDLACLDYLEDFAFNSYIAPEEVAAIIFEPIQGDAGWHIPPDEWVQRLREICEKHGILLVAEEVQTGFGRTGKWFAVDHWNLVPDILLLGKSIGGGVPYAAAVVKSSLFEGEGKNAEGLGNTLSYNPLSVVATCTNIEIIEKENLVENSAKLGEYTLNRLKEMQEDSSIIGDVRGKGLLIGVEIVKDKKSKHPSIGLADKIVEECFKKGLYLIHMGAFNTSVLRIAPPLIINKEQMDSSLDILEKSIHQAEKSG
jgi:4-aminobutyrate aminotransferase